jgi:osmoprotectant transport system permease protein
VNYLFDNFGHVASLTKDHVVLALLPLFIGLTIAVPAGTLVRMVPWLRRGTVVVASVAYTVPSLVLLVIIPPMVGITTIDPLNVVITLSVYSTALLIIAVPAALDSVPASVIDSAAAVGYTTTRRALTVEMPLAIPVFVSSLRVVVVTNLSMVSVGALIGQGALGKLFTQGYQRDYPDEIFTGIIVTLLLALIFDRVVYVLGRIATPWVAK